MKLFNCTIDTFIDYIKDKTLVCFGAGTVFDKFIKEYESYNIVEKITCIVDNDSSKQGSFLPYKKEIPIVGINSINNINNIVMLITCADSVSILEQLNELNLHNLRACFSANFIINYTNENTIYSLDLPENLKFSPTQFIPKVIHYCWFGGKKLPKKNKQYLNSWKKNCPDYEIKLWNEYNYDVTKNKYMYDAYKNKKWSFVSDYARLDIIYNYGGIYLDTDVELVKCLDDLLYQDGFAGVESSRLINLGLGFGAKPQNNIVYELMKIYDGVEFIKADGKLNLCSMPRIQKAFYTSMGYKNNGKFQKLEGMTVYPEIVLSGKNNVTGKINITDRTYAIHHYDGSWNSEEKRRSIVQNQKLYNESLIVY